MTMLATVPNNVRIIYSPVTFCDVCNENIPIASVDENVNPCENGINMCEPCYRFARRHR